MTSVEADVMWMEKGRHKLIAELLKTLIFDEVKNERLAWLCVYLLFEDVLGS